MLKHKLKTMATFFDYPCLITCHTVLHIQMNYESTFSSKKDDLSGTAIMCTKRN